jgi:hypothetical protein
VLSGRAITSLVASIGFLGCYEPVPEEPRPVHTIAGRWGASGGGAVLELTLTVRGAQAAGVGVLIGAGGRIAPVTVRGRYTPPAFALELVAYDHILGRYIGRLDAESTLRGVLSDLDLPTDSLILMRLADRTLPRIVVPHWQ